MSKSVILYYQYTKKAETQVLAHMFIEKQALAVNVELVLSRSVESEVCHGVFQLEV
jgi:hypothetical protein